ncbi:MAG: MarR family transcriptional regulator [Actinomycetota bacterium]
MHEDHDNERKERAWRVFLSANVQLMERLDQELQQRSHLNLTDYEILSVLSGAPDRRLRMSDLARQVLVSRSRLTYRVDRLAEVNFVTREECEDDRRGLWAILTDDGANALASAKVGHDRDIDNWFFDHMGDEELAILTDVMSRIDGKLTNNRNRPGF